jgi:hypothetical protein
VPLQVDQAWALAVALGIGLLLGVERERGKGERLDRAAAGVRTFALVAFLGSLSIVIPVPGLPILVGAFVGIIAVVAYARTSSTDPGTTTEIALMVAYLLGMLTQSALSLAASLAVVITIVLASRDRLHTFVTDILTEDEFRDALLLAAVALVILPLVPDVGIGPYQAFNPFTTWRFVVIVMLPATSHSASWAPVWGSRSPGFSAVLSRALPPSRPWVVEPKAIGWSGRRWPVLSSRTSLRSCSSALS